MHVVELKPKAKQNAVHVLERALEAAKAGDIQQVAISALGRNHDVLSAWSKPDSVFLLLAAIDQLKWDYRTTEIEQD